MKSQESQGEEMNSLFEEIRRRMDASEGMTGFYYKNLITGESFGIRETNAFEAASVIKVPIMVAAFEAFEKGIIEPEELYTLRREDKYPSCGALNMLHDGLQLTWLDLVTLMIILSDNSATNLFIHRLGMEQINACMRQHGLKVETVNRLLFDTEKSRMGIQNYVSPEGVGRLYEAMYRGELVSKNASGQMLHILKNQRLNGKMPFYLDEDSIAHKTGEDDGITHDTGIVFAEKPFIACFTSNRTQVPQFERLIQEVTKELAELQKEEHG